MEYETSSLGAVVGQATRTPAGDRLVLLSGFGFEQIRDDDFDGIRDQSEHLLDILSAMEPSLPCAGTEGLIEVVPDGVADHMGIGRLCRFGRNAYLSGPGFGSEPPTHQRSAGSATDGFLPRH